MKLDLVDINKMEAEMKLNLVDINKAETEMKLDLVDINKAETEVCALYCLMVPVRTLKFNYDHALFYPCKHY